MRNLSLYSSFTTKMRKEAKKKRRTISVNNNQKITGADIESLFRQLSQKKKRITGFLDVNREKKKRAENKQKKQFATEREKQKKRSTQARSSLIIANITMRK